MRQRAVIKWSMIVLIDEERKEEREEEEREREREGGRETENFADEIE